MTCLENSKEEWVSESSITCLENSKEEWVSESNMSF